MAVGIARMRETRRTKRKEKVKREAGLICGLPGFDFGIGVCVGATLIVEGGVELLLRGETGAGSSLLAQWGSCEPCDAGGQCGV